MLLVPELVLITSIVLTNSIFKFGNSPKSNKPELKSYFAKVLIKQVGHKPGKLRELEFKKLSKSQGKL